MSTFWGTVHEGVLSANTTHSWGGLCEVFRTFDWSEMMADLGKLKEKSNILNWVK